ncbi:hypothetical protein [Halomonas sp. OfavH-34-E]|uniref:hypothetical protein n=1 Tax=Halomonas sp. OfavH-34-E TaxID=2954491 RepID=UPI002097D12C|nr:hypothetical protein [Halomonas sp. OfavH-34-E]MCO7217708.1 hypothetical protein [Halomonas sp. OfavH-34-E]
MSSYLEKNFEEWKEIRSRVDSIINGVFILAGGGLSLSISIILGNKGSGIITNEVQCVTAIAWWCLLASVIFAVLLKAYMVLEAFLLQINSQWVDKHLKLLNSIGWVIGIFVFFTLASGLCLMVYGAQIAVQA